MDYNKYLERTDFNKLSYVYTMHFLINKADFEEMAKKKEIVVMGRRYKVIGNPRFEHEINNPDEKRMIALDLEQLEIS